MSYSNKIFRHYYLRTIVFIICLLYLAPLYASGDRQHDPMLNSKAQQLMSRQKPLSFQENKGQMADIKGNPVPYVLYKAEVPDLNIWITTNGITYQFFRLEEKEEQETERGGEENIKCEWYRVDMILKDADIRKENIITEGDVTQGKVNYYLGHCPDGIFNVKSYTKITIKEIYPGIDWVLYTSSTERGNSFTHDFIVHPGADPDKIKLIYEGSGQLNIDNSLIKIKTELGEIAEGKLLCYQGNVNNKISSQYTVKETEKNIERGFSYEVGIHIGDYNTNETLIIDPKLEWGTYYGGNQLDGFCSDVVDANGNLFITGYVSSANFPLLDPGGSAYYQGVYAGNMDVCILKFNNNGVLLWATYYGGNGNEASSAIATDAGDNIIITGRTSSVSFPVLDPGGGAYYQSAPGGGEDIFILEFDNSGMRKWSTYCGGSSDDIVNSIAIDVNGNIYITGETNSNNLPVSDPGGGAYYDNTFNGGTPVFGGDAFIIKFNNNDALLWSTYYGGSGDDCGSSIATDGNGNVFITGSTSSTDILVLDAGGGAYYQVGNAGSDDVIILKFNNNDALLWSTYYGGSGYDCGSSIATDGSDNVFIAGVTTSTDIPVLDAGGGAYYQGTNAGSIDGFVLKFNNSGMNTWATYYGGSGDDYFDSYKEHEMVIDGNDNLYVSCQTYSTNFPVLDPGGDAYFQGTYAGSGDVFILEFSKTGALLWGTYNGTLDNDFGTSLAVDAGGCIFAVGEWYNTGSNGLLDPGGGTFYNASWGGFDDSYIMKFCPCCLLEVTTQPQDQLTCSGDSITFFIQANSDSIINYQWFFNGNIISGAVDSFYTVNPVTVNDEGDYYCVASNSCGTDTSDLAELNIDIPTASAGNNVNICIGNNAALSASGGTSYVWNSTETTQAITVTPTVTSTYTVTVTNATGCTDTDDVVVIVNPALTANAGTDQTICENDQAVLTATGGVLYKWSTTETTQTITVTPIVTSTYTVTQTYNATGACAVTDEVVVTVNPIPVINAGTDQTICEDGQTVLTATGGTTYQWSTGTTTDAITVSPQNTVTYTVTGADSNGCSDTDEVTVTLDFPPSDINLGTDTCVKQGAQMILDAGTGLYTYLWQDGNSGETYTVTIAGDYWVDVSNGCGTVSDTIIITECPLAEIFIPNTFTPNGDGINDVFIPVYTNITDFEMYVFDRWGQEIYSTTDINKGWDGKFEGKLCQEGVYSWLIYYKSVDSTVRKKKFGHVTLLK